MTDGVSPARSRIMWAVRSKNTIPEVALRKWLHAAGYRFRLHRKDLPGNPDIVFPSRRKALFVHGCFWHGHNCPRGSRQPKTNVEYWTQKIKRNRERDEVALVELRGLGWDVEIVWECEMKEKVGVMERLRTWLDN